VANNSEPSVADTAFSRTAIKVIAVEAVVIAVLWLVGRHFSG
jgi:hypothetical protein